MSKIGFGSNIASLRTQRSLNDAATQGVRVSERLSTGLRINHASDDAAGLSIASTLRGDLRVFTQGIRNLNDGISFLQIGEGALNALTDIVIRQKELAEQSANGTLGVTQRRAIQTESEALTDEYNRVVATTSFNGVTIFSATSDTLKLQGGYATEGMYSIDVGNNLSETTGNGSFGTAEAIAFGSAQRSVVASDFNKDGFDDIVVAGSAGVNVKLSNGDGTFGANVNITGVASGSVLTADFNHDGNLDILGNSNGGFIRVALGNGNGTFASSTVYGSAVGGSAVQMDIGDLNNDGILDVVQITTNSQAVAFLGNSNGSFSQAYTYSGPVNGHSIGLGDFNNDGQLDMTYGAYDVTGITMRYGAGNGSFGSAITVATNNLVTNIHVGDINVDGFDDILYSGGNGTSILLSNGNGTFRAESEIQPLAGGAFLSDINGDGILDVQASNYPADAITVHLGNGDGTFKASTVYNTGTGGDSYEVGVGDFDGNGTVDIIATDYAANSLTMFRGIAVANFNSRYFNLAQQDDARESLTTLGEMLAKISSEAGALGAFRSRLEIGMNALTNQSINYQSAESRIMDADVAVESANLVRVKIIQSTAAEILSQANQLPSLALQLLARN